MEGLKRRAALGAAMVAVAVTLVGVGVAAQPPQAQAFAWKDTCTINVVNRGAQSSVRPYGLVQFPPSPIAYALYITLAAAGMPTNTSVGFSNTGFPITAGCQSGMFFTNPGDDVKCHAGAPTVGANNFTCSGNASFTIQKDNDDIEGTVTIPRTGAAEPSPLTRSPLRTQPQSPKPQKNDPGVLKKSQLSGKGWKKTEAIADLGTFGELFEGSPSSTSCGDDDKEATPLSGGGSLFVRGKGAEGIGELDGRYASEAQSKSTLAAAAGKAGTKCLAQALSAPGYRVTVAPTGPDFGQGGIATSRIVIKKNGGGFTGYVDLVGLQVGRSNTVLVFFNAGKPAPVVHEEDVLEAVADQLRP